MRLGNLTLVTTYSPTHIDKDIPAYHQELLRAWAIHCPHHARINPPASLPEILNEPPFRNDLVQLEGQALYNRAWITAGITQIKDICYLAIPGLLPVRALHELITQQDVTISRPLAKTAKEFQGVLRAIPRVSTH